MHPEDIKAGLRKRGVTCADIARDLGITRNAVSLVVHNHATSRPVAERIAAILGRSPDAIWPGRYRKAA